MASRFIACAALILFVMVMPSWAVARSADVVVLRVVPGTTDVHEPTQTSDGRLWFINRGRLCNYDGLSVLCPPIDLRPAKLLALPNRQLLVHQANPDRFVVLEAGRYVREIAAPDVKGPIDALCWWQGRIWLAKGKRLSPLQPAAGPASIEAKSTIVALATRGPKLYVATSVDIEALEVVSAGLKPKATLPDGGLAITALGVAADESLWIGTMSGLWHDGRVVPQNSQIEGWFSGRAVEGIHLDHENNVWIPSASGLIHLRVNDPIQVFASAEGLGGEVPFGVAFFGPKEMWLTDNQGVNHWYQGRFMRFGVNSGFTHLDLRSLAVDADGRPWIAGLQSGLWTFKDSKPQHVKLPMPSERQGIRSLLWHQGKLWLGFERGGLGYLNDARHFEHIGSSAESNLQVGPMASFGETLWLGYRNGGFGRVRGDKLEANVGHTEAFVTCLLPLDDDDLLLGTKGAGLFRYRHGAVHRLTAGQGLPSDFVYSLQIDARDRLWLGSDRGVSVVSMSDVQRGFAGGAIGEGVATFGTLDGMRATEAVHGFFPSSALTEDQKLWQPTVSGLTMFDTARLPLAAALPTISIHDLNVAGHFAAGNETSFAVGDGRVEAVVEGTTFVNPHRLRLRYAVYTADAGAVVPAWVPATNNRYVSLAGLRPGSYVLRAQAFYADNPTRVSEAIKTFILRPPFWKTVPFYLAVALVLAFAGAATYRIRIANLRRRHAGIMAERRRISRDMHDGLQQDLVGLMFHIDAALITLEMKADTRLHLEKAAQLAAEGVRDLKTAISGLVADEVTVAALATTIEGHSNRLFAGSQVQASVKWQGTNGVLSVHAAGAALYIVRELMTNAFKHANANQLDVTLSASRSLLTIRVQDDGIGVADALGKVDGGLANMRLRAKEAGITVSFGIRDPRGFGAQLSIPLASVKVK